MLQPRPLFKFFKGNISVADSSAVATVEATEAAASVKILTGAIIISVIKITIVTFNANSTIWVIVLIIQCLTAYIDDVGGSSYTDDDEEDILNELLSTSLSQLM